MLIELKVKTKRTDSTGKTRKKTETYLINKDFFAEAEYAITEMLTEETNSHLLDEFEILSLKISQLKEIATQYQGENPFIISLKDVFHEDDGTEKYTKYKILLWADSLTEANSRAHELSMQGYDMLIESIKQVDYIFMDEEENETQE